MRLLAIGDIHGCLLALDTLLDRITPGPEDQLITLGDYLDRGPDSRGVLERLIALNATGRLIPLRGNHDEMLLLARDGRDRCLWLTCGGRNTLASYGIPDGTDGDYQAIPDRHFGFLEEDCRDYYETDTHFFVHANVDPDLPLAEQSTAVLYWDKLFVTQRPHLSGKVMVCGHTRQRSGVPLSLGHTICIDTGVYEPAGWLTGLDVLSGEYWQANQRGEFRSGWLEEAR
jgi:serine/threonine protein phosphatase 1